MTNSVQELLSGYVQIRKKLLEKEIIRSGNLVGDLAEYISLKAFGDENSKLEANSKASYDLTDKNNKKVQVKARITKVNRNGSPGSTDFSYFRSYNFDYCIFIMFDDNYSILKAIKIPHEKDFEKQHFKTLLYKKEKQKGFVTKTTRVLSSKLAEDVTYLINATYKNIKI